MLTLVTEMTCSAKVRQDFSSRIVPRREALGPRGAEERGRSQPIFKGSWLFTAIRLMTPRNAPGPGSQRLPVVDGAKQPPTPSPAHPMGRRKTRGRARGFADGDEEVKAGQRGTLMAPGQEVPHTRSSH